MTDLHNLTSPHMYHLHHLKKFFHDSSMSTFINFLFICVAYLHVWLHVCLYAMCVLDGHGGQKRPLDTLGLELHMIVSCYGGPRF